MEGLKSGRVEVVPYSPTWPQKYAAEARLLHADVAEQYRLLKERLAAQYAEDRTSYTTEKKAFVERVTELAMETKQCG